MKCKTRKEALEAVGSGVYESLNAPLATALGRDLLDKQIDIIETMQSKDLRYLPMVSYFGAGGPTLACVCLSCWLDPTGLAWRTNTIASVGLCVCGIIKIVSKGPRPYWLSDKIKTLDPTLETSFGFPSGHTASAACIQGVLAWRFNLPWLWALFGIYLTVLACSRVYTGAHFIHDVIGGALCGGMILLADIFIEVVLGHAPGTPGSLIEATLITWLGIAALGTAYAFSDGSGRVKLATTVEAVSGAGFALGTAVSHLLVAVLPRQCVPEPTMTTTSVLYSLGVLVVISKIIDHLPEYPDGSRDVTSMLFTVAGFAAMQIWTLWAVPALHTVCPTIQ